MKEKFWSIRQVCYWLLNFDIFQVKFEVASVIRFTLQSSSEQLDRKLMSDKAKFRMSIFCIVHAAFYWHIGGGTSF